MIFLLQSHYLNLELQSDTPWPKFYRFVGYTILSHYNII